MRQLRETWQRLNRPARLSYRKMAIGVALGSTAIAIVINVVYVAASENLWFLPFAVIASVLPGPLGYLTVRWIWVTNKERLSEMGHRW